MAEGVTIAEARPALVTIVAVPGGVGEVERLLGDWLGAPLPAGPALARGERGAFVRLGPMRFLLVAGEGEGWRIERALTGLLGDSGLATDQSAARVVFRLAGPGLVPLLETLGGLDFAAFRPGIAATTDLHGVNAILWAEEDGAIFAAVPRSYAASFAEALQSPVR